MDTGIGNNLLAIESAISGGSLGLFRDGTLIAGNEGPLSVSRAEDLVPKIDLLLRSASVNLAEIDMVAVSVGPGSFTGLRIGLSTAAGLSAALNKPLVGVRLFEAIAAKLAVEKGLVIAVPIGRSDICFQDVASLPSGMPRVGTLVDLTDYIRSSEAYSVAVHLDITDVISREHLGGDVEIVDLGTNMAEYIGYAAPDRPAGSILEPMYVQNPRFR